MKTTQQWFDEADTLCQAGKFREADKCLDEAIALDNKFMQAYRWKFKVFYGLGEFENMVQWCDKAISIDPNYFYAYNSKGNALRELKKLDQALAAFNKAIEIDPKHSFPYVGKGDTLGDLGKHQEAIESFCKVIELDPKDELGYNGKALQLKKINKPEEAMEAFDKAVEVQPKSTLCLCNRGKLLSEMGHQKEALADFRKIKELIEAGHVEPDSTPLDKKFIEETLKSVFELHDLSDQTMHLIRNVSRDDPEVKKFAQNVRAIRKDKKRITEKIIANAGKVPTGKKPAANEPTDEEVAAKTEEFKKEIERMKQELVRVQKELDGVRAKAKELDARAEALKKPEPTVDLVKADFDQKFSDIYTKLEQDLQTQSLSSESKKKMLQYFRAFSETFTAFYATCFVAQTGHVHADFDTEQVVLLSAIATLAPYLGDNLPSDVKNFKDFFVSKDIKPRVDKMNELCRDNLLDYVVGNSAPTIALNKDKQKQVLKASPEETKAVSSSLHKKVQSIYEKLEGHDDFYLYENSYKAPASKIGHLDANRVISAWLDGKLDAARIQDEFVKIALSKDGKQPVPKSGCCNMF